MASGGESRPLTDELIAQLSQVIPARSLERIAIRYLGLDHVRLENIKDDVQKNPQLVNFEILCFWRNKNRGTVQVR